MRAGWYGLLLISIAAAFAGCGGGLQGDLADQVCACQHCDDWAEEELKAALDAEADIADAYACDAEFEKFIQCQIDKGDCNERLATWSIRKPVSCNVTTMCATDAECMSLGGACGIDGNCETKLCSGGGNVTCKTTNDCPPGEDRCADEKDDYNKCIDMGSEHHGPDFNGD